MMKKEIIPAIIAKDQEELESRIDNVKDNVCTIQLDVMDGIFVKNRSIDFDFKLPEKAGRCSFEAHLMVTDPYGWIERNIDKVDTVLVHIESCSDPEEIIDTVHKKKKRVGFALNPKTDIQQVRPYIERLDQVLVMTVEPGFYGSKFVREALNKVRELRELAPEIDIEVDGGMHPDTIGLAAKAGANLFVSGSFTVDSDDPAAAIAALKKEVQKEVEDEESQEDKGS